MTEKTGIRQFARFLPMSAELAEFHHAIVLEGQADSGAVQAPEITATIEEIAEAPTTGAEALERQLAEPEAQRTLGGIGDTPEGE